MFLLNGWDIQPFTRSLRRSVVSSVSIVAFCGLCLTHAAKADDSDFAGNRLLHPDVYGLLDNTRPGGDISVEFLYDSGQAQQQDSILRAFPNQSTATKAEILRYMRRTFELRAIEDFTGKKPEQIEDIDAFIMENESSLRGVSDALLSGRLFLLTFKALNIDKFPLDMDLLFNSLTPNDVEPAWNTDPIYEQRTRLWNERYGELNEEALLDLYLSSNAVELLKEFGREDFSKITNEFATRINYDLSLEEVRELLSPENWRFVENGMLDLARQRDTSSYMYFTRFGDRILLDLWSIHLEYMMGLRPELRKP